MTDVELVKAAMRKKEKNPEPIRLLSTGSTLLNLACSGRVDGGFPLGGYVFLVGDSMSGKTWLSLSCMAEASVDSRFDDYRFIHDAVERGAWMDFERYFGKRMADRLEPPSRGDDGSPVHSGLVEEFYYHLDDAFKVGKPFIYVEDSMDALDTMDDEAKFGELKKAHRDGKEVTGSYGTSKAKLNSANIRKLPGRLEKSGSILIVISQTRDDISTKNPFGGKTRSGGHALRFYATMEIWSSVVGKIERTFRGKKRQQGVKVRLDVRKNRITGKQASVVVPIYHSYGIDDVGSCVDYLCDEGKWKRTKEGAITAIGLGPEFKGKREKVVGWIEEGESEEDLRQLVQATWDEVEAACRIERKGRYEV